MRHFLILTVVVLGCGKPPPSFGGLTVDATKGFAVTDPTKHTLLTAFTAGTDAYAAAATRTVKARYEMQFGSWRITEGNGAWTQATRFEWSTQTASTATGSWKDAKGNDVVLVTASSPGEGELKLDVQAATAGANRVSLAFTCEAAERFLGFGAQADSIDHHGHTVPIWVSEPGIGKRMQDDTYPDLWMLEGTRHASSYALPTWTSNHHFQAVVETDARSVFELCSVHDDATRIEVWSDHFTLWLFDGAPAQALSLATNRVLGRPRRPPALAFAPWNDAIFGSDSVVNTAHELRDAGIPSSLIWTEDFRGGQADGVSYRLVENWDLDPSLYPDAGGVARALAAEDFAWLAYFNTFVVSGNPIFDEALDGGHLVKDLDGGPYLFSGPTFKPTGFTDLSRPETREWVKSHMRRALDVGFTGWMADFGEWLPHDAVLASGADPLLAHNRYPLEWDTLNREVLDERQDGVTRLFFARSGWFRSNEVTDVVWAGDQRTDFEPDDGFPTVVPLALTLGLAGVSTFGSDIGGYQSATNPVSTKELFFRWDALGALSPVMRTHHGTIPTQNWRFDSDAETLAHHTRWATLHQQLLPYLDAAALEANTTGMPIMRALPLMFPDDPQTWTISDEYLFGPSLLVTPVLNQGQTSRTAYFPAGLWVSWDGSSRFTGPSSPVVQAPLSEQPLFARAGAVVPMLTPKAIALSDGHRVLRLFVGGETSTTTSDGSSFTVTSTSGTAWLEGGVALPDCMQPGARGCVDRSGALPVVRLSGASSLDVPGAHLAITTTNAPVIDVEVVLP
jgi:alpha-glucosidase (family GH31 glycosyl hydrolase)